MPKRIVVCCDGTWDQPVEKHEGRITCTNVHKLANAVALTDDDGVRQVTHYHAGVGTGTGLDHWLGGGLGAGLARNVLACYRFLVDFYEPGDELFLFGFSRGAFTARSLAGLVRNSGVLRAEHADRVKAAFALYRDRGSHPSEAKATAFRQKHSYEPRILCMGVWDTVGALGIPVRIPGWRRLWGFHDTELSSHIDNAFHAVAVDERRRPFRPTLWSRASVPPGQRLEQVWFSGVHKDVGGGYADSGLADIALRWMVERAEECGLAFAEAFAVTPPPVDAASAYLGLQVCPDPLARRHDSMSLAYRTLGRIDRAIPDGRVEHSAQSVAASAQARAAAAPAGERTSPHLAAYLEHAPAITPVTVLER